jgi:hypothetical protein
MSDAIEMTPKAEQVVEKGSSLQEEVRAIETKVTDIVVTAVESELKLD